jgi:IclR family mhp operon transcriptional activator
LNIKKRLSVAELAREIGLPRTTTYRILENLRSIGYLYRDEKDGRYGLTILVKNLSSGFYDTAWLSEIIKPLAVDLAKTVIWPISIISPRNSRMSLRFTTDTESPLALDYYSEGLKLPILTTASGHVYMAYCNRLEREVVLDTLRKEDPDDTNLYAHDNKSFSNLIETVREQGYALNIRSPRSLEPGKTNTIALPIMRNENFLCALAMRYIASAMNIAELKERYLPTLLEFRDQMQNELNAAEDF